MKKLMTVIAAVAMSFGLFAEPASHFISFETADECEQGGKLVKEGWVGDASIIELDGGYNYTGADARRDDGFADKGGENIKCLKLETGKEVVTCTPDGDTDNIFFDQVVKFTGYEEDPTVTEGKIAIWATAIEADDKAEPAVIGETNLYITCGMVNGSGEIEPTDKFLVRENIDIDAWHRVTIKSLGNVVKNGNVAGFIVYIDGAQVQLETAKGLVDASVVTDGASSYNASGMLFPALEAGTVEAVAYQGIGELDDVAIDNLGPQFARFVEGTVAQISGATLVITDENGEEIEVKDNKFQAAPNSTITLTYTADTGKFLTGGKEKWTSDQIITQDNKDFTELVKDVASLTKVAQYNDEDAEPTFTDSLQEALNLSATDDEVVLLTDETLTAKLVIPAEFGAGLITLGENTITLAADQAVGIDILADGVTIDGGTIASALTANVAGSKAINIPNVDVSLDGTTIDAAHYEYAIYANCDDDCVAAGDQLSWFYTDTEDKFAELNCSGVSITGNGSLFHVEGMVANLKNCSAVADTNPLFGAAHQAAVYSSLNSTTTISGEGTYTHVNALQSGNLGGKIVVAEGSEAEFTGNIKSYMKVGAHDELKVYDNYVAQFKFNAGTYTGNIVFEDATARELDSFWKAKAVEINAPAGYKWDTETGILVPCDYVVEIVGVGQYESLADALKDAQDGNELKLLDNITLTSTATVNANITLNLNEKTITGSWNTGIVGVGNREYIFELGASAVTVKGGTVSSTAANIGGFHTVGGTLSIEADAVVDTAWRAVGVYSGATLNVAEGATLKTSNVDPTIMVIANGKKTTLNIDGIVQNTCSAATKAAADRPHNLDAAIMGSGNDTAADIVAMNIGATAQISATAAAGIYAPNAGTVTVANGAKITGFTYGIYAKSGNLVINGGTITATADTAVVPTAFNDGVNGQGYAVLLETGAAAGGYANNLVANIQGGKFTSTGAAVYNFDRSAAGDSPIAACISGGLFKEKPADALLVASTTEGYKAAWVLDETGTGYYKPGAEAIEYTITYKYTDDQGVVKEITDLYPNEYDVEDAGTLPLPTEMPTGFTGGELEAWYTNAELTGEPVSVIPVDSIGEKTFWAKLKSVVDPVEEEIEANVNTEGLDDAAKAKVYENTVKLNTACGGDDKAMAWMTAVYGNQKVPGAKLAATTDDLIAISVKYDLPILGKEPTVEIAAATEGEGFTFQIKDDGTPVSLEAAKENIIKMVEFTDALGTKEFADATANDITVTASGNTATAAFTKKTDAGFMRVNLKK